MVAYGDEETNSNEQQRQEPSTTEDEQTPPEEETPPSNKETEETTTKATTPPPTPPKQQQQDPFVDDEFDPKSTDWGSYYDPRNVFCGKFDCYKILGFDYESFVGKTPPDSKVITKHYRRLSREWHPDKSKHKQAKNRFVKINRAYQVLTNEETRKEYDYMRYDQEAYYHKYGTSILFSYAPKSDVTFVLLLIIILANVFSWYSQKHRWQLVADRLIKAALEDWSTAQGGTPESKQLREQALEVFAKREAAAEGRGEENESSSTKAAAANGETTTLTTSSSSSALATSPVKSPGGGMGKKQKNASKKVPGKEKKRLEQEALGPIIKELVNEMHDFGSGFHKPTWHDLAIVSWVRFPYTFSTGIAWYSMYYIRRFQNKELNDEERVVLTQRAVGPVLWETKSEEERKEMIARRLWRTDNLVEWQDEQEMKNLSNAEQKYYNRMKRKGKID